MVKIRLSRVGTTNQPKYRIVVADEHSPRDGAFIEILGNYDPTSKPRVFELNKDRYQHWLSVGAQPTGTVEKLLAS